MTRALPLVRPVEGSDAAAIVELVHRCFAEYAEFAPGGWTPPEEAAASERMAVALRRPQTGGRVADADGEHAGHVLWIPSADSERLAVAEHDVAYLWQLFVAPDWRGTGVAAGLLGAAREAAGAGGYSEMRLLTPRDHTRARRFYEREGWTRLGDWGVDPELGLALVEYGVRLRERSGQNEGR